MKVRKVPTTRHARISELLAASGIGAIDREEFWRQMHASKLTDKDIDTYCSGKIVE